MYQVLRSLTLKIRTQPFLSKQENLIVSSCAILCQEKINSFEILQICWKQFSSVSVNNVTSSLILVSGMCNSGVFVRKGFDVLQEITSKMKGFLMTVLC